jgi:transcription elongation factor/antiterminator RfaH
MKCIAIIISVGVDPSMSETNTSCDQSSDRWYVLHTHALQESRAEKNLSMWGVETFNPKLKECSSKRASQKAPPATSKSLFPSYMFARFDANVMLHKICFTRGVREVLRSDGSPVPVSEEIIDLVRSRVGEDGFVTTNQDLESQALQSGDEVVVTKGPLSNLEGVFERDLNDSERVVLLLKAVNYQNRVVIDRRLVRKLN